MADADQVYQEIKVASPLVRTWQIFCDNPLAYGAFWVLCAMLVLALLGPLIAPYNADYQHAALLRMPPSWSAQGNLEFFLGTDDLGRDLLSRLLHGARLTIGGAVPVVIIAALCGIALGIWGAFSQGFLRSALHHLTDSLMSLPPLLLAILITALLGAGYQHALIAITLALLPQFVRNTYNVVDLELRKEYVKAFRLDGANNWEILRHCIFPNISEHLVAQFTRGFSSAIIEIAALGFIGLGAIPQSAEWGAMLMDASDLIYIAPWAVIIPGLALVSALLAVNFVGDGLRSAIARGYN